MTEYKWFANSVGGKPIDYGILIVKEDGALRVEPEDYYYNGGIDVFTARRIAEEIWKPMTDARQAGYDAYVANPADTRDAKERDLYPDDQDMRIEWGAGWLQAQIEDELGIDVKAYAPIGGAGMGAIQEAIRKLKQKAGDDPMFDATDGAHPAWWRGCDYGVEQTCEKLQRVATGDCIGKPTFASEAMNKLASDILTLRGKSG